MTAPGSIARSGTAVQYTMANAPAEPVLIVGAGPTGLVLAIELARRRIPCRLIDRKTGPTQTSRSFTLHARTMEMFEHMGIEHLFLADGLKSRGFRFTFKGKAEHPTLDFSGLNSRYPYVLVYNQNQTERRLRQHLETAYDIRIEWGVELTKLEAGDGGFAATLENVMRNAEPQIIHPPWVVGCDGIHSYVRKRMGLEFEGENYEGMVMQMMDVQYHDFPGDEEWVHYFMSRDDFLLVTKLPGRNHRVLISNLDDAEVDHDDPRETFQQLIDGHVAGTRLGNPEWATKWTIWKRLATSYRKGRALLAGDAAHVHSPSGGQGMNIGMQDAYNLGWKLAMVIRGEAKPELLDTYTPERQPIGAQAIAGTDAMHDIIMAHGHGMDDRLALTRKPGWHDETVNRISGLSYTYRDTTQTNPVTPEQEPAVGDRAPDVALDEGRRLFDLLRHPRFTLLILPGGGTDALDASLALSHRVGQTYGAIVKTFVISATDARASESVSIVVDSNGICTELYGGDDGGGICLIRPDGYVAVRCELERSSELMDYLRRWFN